MTKWFDVEDQEMIKEAMMRMDIKNGLVVGGSGETIHEATKSDEEKVLPQMLEVLNEINKKLVPKEEGGEKMPVVDVKVWEGFGQENTKTVIQNIENVFVALGISADAVEVSVSEIPKS